MVRVDRSLRECTILYTWMIQKAAFQPFHPESPSLAEMVHPYDLMEDPGTSTLQKVSFGGLLGPKRSQLVTCRSLLGTCFFLLGCFGEALLGEEVGEL